MQIEDKHKIESQVAAAVVLVAMLVLGAYFVFFALYKHMIAGDPADWGQFGDFFGGVINPVVGIVTVLLVVRTLKVTRSEAEASRKALAEQTTLLERQLSDSKRGEILTEHQKRLNGALEVWNRAMLRIRPTLRNVLMDGSRDEFCTLDEVLGDVALREHLAAVKKAGNWAEGAKVRNRWIRALKPEINLIKEIGIYCEEYEETAGNRIVSNFYRRRVKHFVSILLEAGLISDLAAARLRLREEPQDQNADHDLPA